MILPVVIAATGLLRAVWALRHLTGISTRRALFAFANWMGLSWTVGLACAKGLVSGKGVFLRTPKWRGRGGVVEAMRETRIESSMAGCLWVAAAGLMAFRQRGPMLPALAVWQGSVYASAPMMAWLNLHTELSARLERRQRSEDRRERLTAIQPHVARAGIGVAALGLLALLVVGGATTGDNGAIPALPQRAPDDAGPLGGLGVLPSVAVGPVAPATTTAPTAPPTPTSSTLPVTGHAPPATLVPPPPATLVPPQPGATTAPTQPVAPTTVPLRPGAPATTSSPLPATSRPTPTAPTSISPPSTGPPTSRPGRP